MTTRIIVIPALFRHRRWTVSVSFSTGRSWTGGDLPDLGFVVEIVNGAVGPAHEDERRFLKKF